MKKLCLGLLLLIGSFSFMEAIQRRSPFINALVNCVEKHGSKRCAIFEYTTENIKDGLVTTSFRVRALSFSKDLNDNVLAQEAIDCLIDLLIEKRKKRGVDSWKEGESEEIHFKKVQFYPYAQLELLEDLRDATVRVTKTPENRYRFKCIKDKPETSDHLVVDRNQGEINDGSVNI